MIPFSLCALDNDNLTDFFQSLWPKRRRRNELKTNGHSLPSELAVHSPILAWRGRDRRGTLWMRVRELWLVPVCTADRIMPSENAKRILTVATLSSQTKARACEGSLVGMSQSTPNPRFPIENRERG